MKKISIICLLVVSVLSSRGNGEGTAKKTDSSVVESSHSANPTAVQTPTFVPTIDICTLTNDEDSLDFGIGNDDNNKYVYDLGELANGIQSFGNYFKFGLYDANSATVPLENDTDKVKVGEINRMLGIVKNMMINSQGKYFSALRINYGINARKMVMIYEPIALTRIVHTTHNYWQADTIISANAFFTADNNGNLISLPDSEKNVYVQTYKDSIYIIHLSLRQLTEHHFVISDNNAYLGDVKYCMLPIQQIIREYRENLATCDSAKVDDLVSFNIIADRRYYFSSRLFSWVYRKNYKLHVVASYGQLRQDNHNNTFNGLAADFGQMCPPNCGRSQIPQFSSRTTQ